MGVVAGGYAIISGDEAPQTINNPVSNEITDVNNDSVIYNEPVQDIVKDVAAKSIVHKSNDNAENISSDFALNTVDNVDNSSKPVAHYMAYASNVGAASYGNYDDVYTQPISQSSYDPFSNINKEDYVLSPNYNRSIFIKIGQDFTDKYGQCVVDGFIPLGNITKPIHNLWKCDLECGLGEAYLDLSSPYVYDTSDVIYFMAHGTFPDDVEKKQYESELNQLAMNYRKVDGQNEVFVNVHDDFTDKYMLCMDCGRFFALGNVTTPLDDIMICDHPNHFGGNVYIDGDNQAVISPEEARNSWDDYLQNLYSNPNYHPIHFDEEGYGQESELLQQYDAEDSNQNSPDAENPVLVIQDYQNAENSVPVISLE